MKNRRRCRLHGGLSTGPRTPEGLARIRAARTTHGLRTAEMEELRELVRELRATGCFPPADYRGLPDSHP